MKKDDQRKLTFGVILIVAIIICFVGNPLTISQNFYPHPNSCIIKDVEPTDPSIDPSTNPLKQLVDGIIVSNSKVPPKSRSDVIPRIGNKPQSTWTYSNNTYLQGYPPSVSNQRISTLTLTTALNLCVQIRDCNGVTKVDDDYELRSGKVLVPSNAGEQSWSAETVKKPAVQEYSNCVRSENTVINEANILAKYPAAAKARKCGADGQFFYEEKYKHLNSLLKFSTETKYPSILVPTPCPQPNENKTLLLFGIKSMSSHLKARNAIRSTWLNRKHWQFEPDLEIHYLFLLGTEEKATVPEEEHEYMDILQSDFMESHYNLSIKDHDFFTFIELHCPHVDYVFKGDDDILLVPENAMFHINKIKDTTEHSMIGCLKQKQATNRRPESKYFAPSDIIADPFLPQYFSGAGYFMSKLAISKILPIRDTVPILHLDDVYIGKLIAKAKIVDQMVQSVSICTGVHAFEETIYKGANAGWGITEAPTTPCFMSGLTVFHRFLDPDEMVAAFNKLKGTDVSKSCQQPADITKITNRWAKPQLKFIAIEWQALFNNYGSYVFHNT